MGLIAVIVIAGILLFTSFGRGLLMRLILFAIVAVVGYNFIMGQVNRAQQSVAAGVQSAGSIPEQLLARARDAINEFFGDGRQIMEPLIGAADVKTELYEYCLADVAWVSGGVNPSQCQALPAGRDRTACFEKQLASVNSFDGVSDLSQIDDLRSQARNQCNMRFNVTDAMPKLLDAGVRGVGQLYRYCEIPGACEESTFDNAPYRDCLKDKFESPRPQGLGLTKTYCGVFRTSEDREKWRKCVEVSMIQQTADVASQVNDEYVAGVAAIRSCRQL
jgi:hypothetical protein